MSIARHLSCVPILMFVAVLAPESWSKEANVHPVAVFPFSERGPDAADLGTQVSDLLFASLVEDPDLYLVERAEISRLLEEQELSLSGLAAPGKAVQVGQLTGAKIIVTGSVVVAGDKQILIAKIIGTETSRVVGASVRGSIDDELTDQVDDLAKQVRKTISARVKDLLPKNVSTKDRVARLQKTLGDAKRPALWIDVKEEHIGQSTIDPAAATELGLICQQLGFRLIDSETGKRKEADIILTGAGFSAFAARRGNLHSVKARVELKAVRQNGELIATDRQVAVAVDLSEQIAGKTALQNAAAALAERIIPALVKD